MATSQRSKGSYHEKWWVKWFEEKGCEAKRQPLSGQLGGEFRGDIQIKTKDGVVIAESKYQAEGRGFSFLTKVHNERGPAFICIEISNPLAAKIIGCLSGRKKT